MTHMNNTTTYNGYTNRATWNLMLWISNDESAYNFFREGYEQFGGDVIEDRERKIAADAHQWFGSRTPDDDRLEDVNWEEVREHLDEDFSEYVQDLD